jgi:hypothetical protein
MFKDGNKALYECWFVNNSKNGKGRMIRDDNTIYEGEFVDGKFHGFGIYTYSEGMIYKG